MESKYVAAVGGVALVAALGLGAFLLSTKPIERSGQLERAVQAQFIPQPSIAVVHTLTDGVHVWSGSLSMPACNTLASAVRVSTLGEATIDLMVLTTDPSCVDKTMVEQPFSASASVHGSSVVLQSLTLNGKPIDFTIAETR